MTLQLRKLAAVLIALPLMACTASAADESVDAVKAAFKTKFPQHEISTIQPAPVAGLYEVVVKMKRGAREEYTVVYTDAQVDHLITGEVIDTKTRQSLTEARMEELNKVVIDWNSLPLDKAIKEVRGKGERKLVVFSDPDCPFCKRLEQESLAKLDNVTVYTFLYPLTQLHPDAARKSTAIWCSPKPAETWTGFMRNGTKLPTNTNCKTPLSEIAQLGERLGITGTPALIFPNGKLVPGAIPLQMIEDNFKAK